MPRKDAPEFSYDPKTELFRKKIKNQDGRWIPIYGKSKSELRQKIKAREEEISALKLQIESPLSFEYVQKWYALWSPGKGSANIESIRNAINNHILPLIGGIRMCDVTEDDLQRVMNNIADKSKGLNIKVLRTIKMIFHAARKDGTILQDPSEDLSPGGKRAKEKDALTELQQKALIAAVQNCSIYPFVMIALYAGLRREEVLALQWDCVFLDDDTPHLSVRRALRWEHNKPIVSDELKSQASKRDIPIPSELLNCLRGEKEKSGGEYVIGGSAPITQNIFRRNWDAIAKRSTSKEIITDKDGKEIVIEKKLGDKIRNHNIYITLDFPVTPHQLRHTYITRLILAGVNIKVVQYLAGHASVDLTLNIYTHLMANRPQDTASAVLSAFGEIKKQ